MKLDTVQEMWRPNVHTAADFFTFFIFMETPSTLKKKRTFETLFVLLFIINEQWRNDKKAMGDNQFQYFFDFFFHFQHERN